MNVIFNWRSHSASRRAICVSVEVIARFDSLKIRVKRSQKWMCFMVRVMDYEMMERRVPLWCRRATSRSMDPYSSWWLITSWMNACSSPRKPVQCVASTVNVCIRWISLHCLMTLTSRIQFVSFPGTPCVKRPTPNLESDLLIRRTQTIAKTHNARSNWASCRVQPSWLSQFTLLHTFLAEEVATPSYSPASMPTVGNACRLFANRAAPLMSHKWLNKLLLTGSPKSTRLWNLPKRAATRFQTWFQFMRDPP